LGEADVFHANVVAFAVFDGQVADSFDGGAGEAGGIEDFAGSDEAVVVGVVGDVEVEVLGELVERGAEAVGAEADVELVPVGGVGGADVVVVGAGGGGDALRGQGCCDGGRELAGAVGADAQGEGDWRAEG
jgi:hypothetical protein